MVQQSYTLKQSSDNSTWWRHREQNG